MPVFVVFNLLIKGFIFFGLSLIDGSGIVRLPLPKHLDKLRSHSR